MGKIDWSHVYPEFTPEENWGDLSILKASLVYTLHDFRKHIGTPICIDCATQGKHAPGSDHYLGYAADVTFPERPLIDLFDLYMDSSRFPSFTGIGLYNFWNYNGSPSPGLHLSSAPRLVRKLWIKTVEKGVIKEWVLNRENLRWIGIV